MSEDDGLSLHPASFVGRARIAICGYRPRWPMTPFDRTTIAVITLLGWIAKTLMATRRSAPRYDDPQPRHFRPTNQV